jgi:hypothetical protein
MNQTPHPEMLSPADDARLDDELAHLRGQLANFSAPAAIEANLARAFRQQQRVSGAGWRHRFGEWFAPGAAIAASLSFSLWLLLGGAPAGISAPDTKSLASADRGNPFIALQSLEQIALEPNPRVIETQVPKMMLASFGLPISPDAAGETVRAEMLVSAAGQPLALRLSN